MLSRVAGRERTTLRKKRARLVIIEERYTESQPVTLLPLWSLNPFLYIFFKRRIKVVLSIYLLFRHAAALQVPPLCRWMQWPRDRAAVRASGPKHRLSFFDPEELDGCGGAVQWWIELRRRTLG